MRTVHALDGVSLSVMPGETLGLVGESGCGKSTLGRCITRLYDLTSGTLALRRRPTSPTLSAREMRPLRRRIQMVFQDPYASLNPRRRVRDLIAEPLRVHTSMTDAEIAAPRRRTARASSASSPIMPCASRMNSPAASASASASRAPSRLNPELIVLDEPVSALDVSVQAQIVNLLADLQERLNLTYVFIAHDLSVVRQVSTRIAVMYLGSIVELGPADDIFSRSGASLYPGADLGGAGAGCHRPVGEKAHRADAATCRARSTRPRAAASTPAARSRRIAAGLNAQCSQRQVINAKSHVIFLSPSYGEMRSGLRNRLLEPSPSSGPSVDV